MLLFHWIVVSCALSAHVRRGEQVDVVFGLRQHKLDLLEERFWSVATPGQPEYRQFLSIEEIARMVQPPPQNVAALLAALPRGVARGDTVWANLTVAEVETLFATEVRVDMHRGRRVLRAYPPVTVPVHLESLVEFVMIEAPPPRSHPSRTWSSGGNDVVVPQTLLRQYGIPASSLGHGAWQIVGMPAKSCTAGFDALRTFLNGVGLPQQDVQYVGGVSSKECDCQEETLDFEYLAAVGLGLDTLVFTSTVGGLYTFLQQLVDFVAASGASKFNVLTLSSFCTDEADVCSSSGMANCTVETYVARTNAEFQKLGLMGVSIFVASGDNGAVGMNNPRCAAAMRPGFPAASPYVTSVGGTELASVDGHWDDGPICQGQYAGECARGGRERAVSTNNSGYASGGGFSNIAARPAYQSRQVVTYLETVAHLPPAGTFNREGRGYPDVSALGSQNLIYLSATWIPPERRWFPIGGTSVSSPIWAGIAGHLNAAAIEASGKPLGFLNPLLYRLAEEHPATFFDMRIGSNACSYGNRQACHNSAGLPCLGYVCSDGWDPVTGLGTPNVTVLLAAVQAAFPLGGRAKRPRHENKKAW